MNNSLGDPIALGKAERSIPPPPEGILGYGTCAQAAISTKSAERKWARQRPTRPRVLFFLLGGGGFRPKMSWRRPLTSQYSR